MFKDHKIIKMETELRNLIKKFKYGGYKETRSSYEKLSNYFQEELNKLEFIELEFSNYKNCYNKLGQLFSDNGVIINQCRTILNYKSSEDFSLNGKWAYEIKGNYNYKNCYNTEEVIVKCKDRKYYLKYRRLNLK